MKPRPLFARLATRSLLLLTLVSLSASLSAALPESLLPVLGGEGEEFSHPAKDGNTVRGWLPAGWVDNSEWAAVSATYSQLVDRPDDAPGAVRIQVEKVDDGALQLTSYSGERTYQAGQRYRICGWLRSPEPQKVALAVRQMTEPYTAFHEGEVASGPTWKPFEFNFQPVQDTKGIVILDVTQTGTIDVAGLTVAEGGPGPSLLPPFGTEGADFRQPSAREHLVQGWLPTEWADNSEWAPVNATYSRLEGEDAPPDTMTAVRIKVETVSAGAPDAGQLQLTSYNGPETYHQGRTYQLTGWVRSAERTPLHCDARMTEDPWAPYHQVDLTTGPEWKPFKFTFRPEKDLHAAIMFVIRQAGTVDLAGVTLTETASAK